MSVQVSQKFPGLLESRVILDSMCAVSGEDDLRKFALAAAEGDSVAVGQIVRHTQVAVQRLCGILGSEGEVDDLVQETYLRVMKSLPKYRCEAPVQVWVLSIARRVCADHVRRRVRRRKLMDRVVHQPITRSVGPDEGVEELLAALDDDRREAFVLTQMLGLSYEEAAVVLDCPIGTIRSRVARARADLLSLYRTAEAQ